MDKAPTTRQLKVAREIQKDLAEILRSKGMAVFDGAMVTVSEVRVSPDLSIAKTYVSIFPSEKGEELLQNIEKNSQQIRYTLGQRVRYQLRIVPELRFFIDDSLDYIDRIDELLKK
jgi:ribosome-binding factor A